MATEVDNPAKKIEQTFGIPGDVLKLHGLDPFDFENTGFMMRYAERLFNCLSAAVKPSGGIILSKDIYSHEDNNYAIDVVPYNPNGPDIESFTALNSPGISHRVDAHFETHDSDRILVPHKIHFKASGFRFFIPHAPNTIVFGTDSLQHDVSVFYIPEGDSYVASKVTCGLSRLSGSISRDSNDNDAVIIDLQNGTVGYKYNGMGDRLIPMTFGVWHKVDYTQTYSPEEKIRYKIQEKEYPKVLTRLSSFKGRPRVAIQIIQWEDAPVLIYTYGFANKVASPTHLVLDQSAPLPTDENPVLNLELTGRVIEWLTAFQNNFQPEYTKSVEGKLYG